MLPLFDPRELFQRVAAVKLAELRTVCEGDPPAIGSNGRRSDHRSQAHLILRLYLLPQIPPASDNINFINAQAGGVGGCHERTGIGGPSDGNIPGLNAYDRFGAAV